MNGELTPAQLQVLRGLRGRSLQLGRGGGVSLANGHHVAGRTVKALVAQSLARYDGAYALRITDNGLAALVAQHSPTSAP